MDRREKARDKGCKVKDEWEVGEGDTDLQNVKYSALAVTALATELKVRAREEEWGEEVLCVIV